MMFESKYSETLDISDLSSGVLIVRIGTDGDM